jgi:hypothetical protein
MKKLLLASAFLCCLSGGCRQAYIVHVNGFLAPGRSVSEKGAVYVAVDANFHNPIFQNQVKGKIEKLLVRHQFTFADREDAADYRIDFALGTMLHEVIRFGPYYGPGWLGPTSYRRYQYSDYGSYGPYAEYYREQRLAIKLSDAGRQNGGGARVVWVGEAVSAGYRTDLRRTIDYLLVAIFEYFGQDTRKRITIHIDQDDPRVMQISRSKH